MKATAGGLNLLGQWEVLIAWPLPSVFSILDVDINDNNPAGLPGGQADQFGASMGK